MIKKIVQQNKLIFLFLTLLVILIYANSLPNKFVSDDVMGILKNEKLGEFGWSLNFAQNWMWAATYHIFGKNPIAFRIENVLFHLLNGWVVFILLFILSRKKTSAGLTALLFAVHPILTESVTWISGGIYAKYSFFLLLAFLFYLCGRLGKPKKITNTRKIWWFVFSLMSFVLALSFSEKAIILPGIIFIYEIAFGSLKKYWLKLVPYFLISLSWLALIFLRIGQRIQDLQKNFYLEPNKSNPFYQIPVAVTKYLELIFWPEKLSLYQTEMFFSPLNFWIKAGVTILFLGVIIFILIKIILRTANSTARQIFFWLCFFVIALLPTLLAFGLAWVVAERYVYLASLGIIAVFVLGWEKLNLRFYETKKMYWAVGILIVLALAARTVARNMDWKNQDSLWLATVKVAPSGHVIHNNLGDMYGRWHQYNKSIQEYKTAIAIQPNYADAMHNLANTYLEIGKLDQAIYWYEQAIKNNSYLWQSYQNLGAIYFNLGKLEKAEELFAKAVELRPEDKALRQNLETIRARRALKR